MLKRVFHQNHNGIVMTNHAVSIDVNDPFAARRPPDWRWRRALDYGHCGIEQDCRQEPVINAAINYLRLKHGDPAGDVGPADDFVLRERHPHIYHAHQCYEERDRERWLLEALVCGGASAAEIAEYLGSPVEFVETYEALFFDARRFLRNPGYIVTRVLKGSFHEAKEDDLDTLWKTIALQGGVGYLKQFIGPVGATGPGEESEAESEAVRNRFVKRTRSITKMIVALKGLAAALTLRVTTSNAARVLNLAAQAEKVEQQRVQLTARQKEPKAEILPSTDAKGFRYFFSDLANAELLPIPGDPRGAGSAADRTGQPVMAADGKPEPETSGAPASPDVTLRLTG